MSDAVYQALLSSALGLSIAIPAYLFYSYLASRSRQIVHSLERAGTEAVCLVCDARQRREAGESMNGRGLLLHLLRNLTLAKLHFFRIFS